MGVFRIFTSEFQTRWKIVCNGKYNGIQRAFALLEIVCFPVSIFTIVALLVQVIMIKAGFGNDIPFAWKEYLSPVMLAGAIGYLTNWLAITMLFRPYHFVKWLWIWPQGMIPRNKPQVATAIGDQIGNKLLSPDKIANELSGRIIEWLKRPDVIAALKEKMQAFLTGHQEEIIDFLVPQIEKTLVEYVDSMVTAENIQKVWETQILPRLNDEENRQKIAEGFAAFCIENSPSLISILHERVTEHLKKKLAGIPFVNNFADQISSFVMDFFANEEKMKELIAKWLSEPQTMKMLEQNVSQICLRFNEWLMSPQGNTKINEIIKQSRERLKDKLSDYLHDVFPKTVKSALGSEKLWEWFESTALPTLSDMLSNYIIEHRQDIIDNLKLAERIETAINDQDVRQFHKMINEIAAQHLGAIQVLGFILGVMVGLLQLLQ